MDAPDDPFALKLPGSHLVGVPGAQTILSRLSNKPRATLLHVSHNPLGPQGAQALFDGLAQAEEGTAELEDILCVACGIGDQGLESLARYLESPRGRKVGKLWVGNNAIRGTALPELVRVLGAHPLPFLSLSTNPFDPERSSYLLANLSSPSLEHLALTTCRLTYSHAPFIASLISARGRRCPRLRGLSLNANDLGVAGVGVLADALERDCLGVVQLDVFANGDSGGNARLELALGRNRALASEVRAVAKRGLVLARIVLHARRGAAEEDRKRTFRLLDLPPELWEGVVRGVDKRNVLSQRQWGEVMRWAGDRGTLGCVADDFWEGTGCDGWDD